MTLTPEQAALMRERFAERARRDHDQLTSAIAADDVALIRAITHKLVGAGGSFGLPDVTLAARRVEQDLRGTTTVQGQEVSLQTLLASLKKAAAD